MVPLLLSVVLCLCAAGCSSDGTSAIFGSRPKEEGEPLLPDYTPPSSAEGGNPAAEEVVVIEEEQDPGDGTAETGAQGLSGFDYDQLQEGVRSVYEQLYTGISERKSEFYITAESAEDVGPALRALLADHPEFFWITGSASIYGFPGPGIKRITLEFNIDPSEIDSQQAMIEAEAAGYLGQIYDGMSEYEKVRLAYEYVIRNRLCKRVQVSSGQSRRVLRVCRGGYHEQDGRQLGSACVEPCYDRRGVHLCRRYMGRPKLYLGSSKCHGAGCHILFPWPDDGRSFQGGV